MTDHRTEDPGYLANYPGADTRRSWGVACNCESSLCDHDGRCPRPADPRLFMAYVEHTCTQCAANMAATGGGEYLSLAVAQAQVDALRDQEANAAEDEVAARIGRDPFEPATIPVHDPNDPEAREPAPATDWGDEGEAESRFASEDYRRDVRGFNDDSPYDHGAGGGDPDDGWD